MWRLVNVALAGLVFLLAGTLQARAAGFKSMTAAAHPAGQTAEAVPDNPTIAELLAAARSAYTQGRIVAPASHNAIAYYLAVQQKDPGNRVAESALREAFPYAAQQVEQTIRKNDFDAAEREIELLTRADPKNYTLTLLRAQLATQQKMPIRGEHVLVLNATGNCWIEITDASGHLVDSRVLHAGESRTYRVSGSLRVVLGNAAAVAVTADGKAVTVKPDRNSKTAHLELFTKR
ncbi:MAG: DUF4115 domain-containing protein [Rhodanobacteraceae bacterium]